MADLVGGKPTFSATIHTPASSKSKSVCQCGHGRVHHIRNQACTWTKCRCTCLTLTLPAYFRNGFTMHNTEGQPASMKFKPKPPSVPQDHVKCLCGHFIGEHYKLNGQAFQCLNRLEWLNSAGKKRYLDCYCQRFTEPPSLEPIPTATENQSEPLSNPEPCLAPSEPADVVITQHLGCWCIMCGHVKSTILTEKGAHFNERITPLVVAEYLASHARGPINVIWW